MKYGVLVTRQSTSLFVRTLSPRLCALGRRLNVDPRSWFLHGGEDYALLFAASPRWEPGEDTLPARLRCHRLGAFTGRFRGVFVGRGDEAVPLVAAGWDHLR